MSTHALVHFHSGSCKSPVLLTVYRHFDGYAVGGLGDALKSAVSKLKPGFSIQSSWLEILAGAHALLGPDVFALTDSFYAEYVYHVFKNDDGSVGLTVSHGGDEIDLLPRAPKVFLGFTYQTPGRGAAWRNIVLVEEDSEHVKGREVDTGEFRCFLKARIYGGVGGIFRHTEGE
jgi:hypothetical protein